MCVLIGANNIRIPYFVGKRDHRSPARIPSLDHRGQQRLDRQVQRPKCTSGGVAPAGMQLPWIDNRYAARVEGTRTTPPTKVAPALFDQNKLVLLVKVSVHIVIFHANTNLQLGSLENLASPKLMPCSAHVVLSSLTRSSSRSSITCFQEPIAHAPSHSTRHSLIWKNVGAFWKNIGA